MLARTVVGEPGRWLEKDRWQQKESRADFFKRRNIHPALDLVAKRKALWVAHVLRGGEKLMSECLQKSKEQQDGWWVAYSEDMEKRCGISWEKVEELSKKPSELSRLIEKNYRVRIGTKGKGRLSRLRNQALRARGASRNGSISVTT